MSRHLRCFVAAGIAPRIRTRLEREIGFLQLAGAAVKWVPRDNLHITLRFIGDTDPNDVIAICDALRAACSDVPPCRPLIAGLETFPRSRRPRVIAAGVTGDTAPLKTLFNNLQRELADVGFRPEPRGLRLHVTLGRVKGGELGDLLTRIQNASARPFGPTSIDRIHLFMSDRTPKGPEYAVMKTFPLLGAPDSE